jgi:ferredoxin
LRSYWRRIMPLLIVDKEKCKKDGFCARECPTGIIRLKEEDGYPSVGKKLEEFCLSCGHCVAVCPEGALSHRDVAIEDCEIGRAHV